MPAKRGNLMASSPWTRWLRSFFRPLPKRARQPGRRPQLEPLESREAPATYIWTGAGTNQRWSTPGNWINSTTGLNQAPTGVAAALEDLVFDNRATQRTT